MIPAKSARPGPASIAAIKVRRWVASRPSTTTTTPVAAESAALRTQSAMASIAAYTAPKDSAASSAESSGQPVQTPVFPPRTSTSPPAA